MQTSLRLNRQLRYAHALQLRDDLRRYENGLVARIAAFRDPARLSADRVTGVIRLADADVEPDPMPAWRAALLTGAGAAAAGVLIWLLGN